MYAEIIGLHMFATARFGKPLMDFAPPAWVASRRKIAKFRRGSTHWFERGTSYRHTSCLTASRSFVPVVKSCIHHSKRYFLC